MRGRKALAVIFDDRRDVAREAARIVARTLRRRRAVALVLATGKTMISVYRELVGLHRAGKAPFRRSRLFEVDELRVPRSDPRSFATFLELHLVSRVSAKAASLHLFRGDSRDPVRECRRIERELERSGGPDVTLLGIGSNGHVAYLEPARSLPPRSTLVRLSAPTRRRLARDGVRPVPREALTMGIETILSSREILLVATGSAKARAVAAALDGPVTPRCPASLLSIHPALTVLLDRAAASGLERSARLRRRPRIS